MLIQGDNLEALKSLLPYYRGQVKCIYIDPPFNTREAISEHYDDNLEHAVWLGIIYPRMVLLNQLLSENGTLFIHLDDNEIAYATVIADEVFGRKNRTALISFKQSSVSGPKSRNPGVVTTTNYIAMYAKQKQSWRPNNVYRPVPRDVRYASWIENPADAFENWQFITLTAAIEAAVGKPVKEWRKTYNGDVSGFIDSFVLENRERVVQLVSVTPADVNEEARQKLIASKTSGKVERQERDTLDDYYFYGGKQVAFYRSKSRVIDGQMTTAERVSNLWDDLLSNNVHGEGGVRFPNGKKPESLIRRCLEIATNPGDLVLDSFLGSGTTAAVAHKMGRRWIGVEMGDHAVTHCQPRLAKVVAGEGGGISQAVGWRGGGGFDFYRLGPAVFDADGGLAAGIGFAPLAAHVWFAEMGVPLILPGTGRGTAGPLGPGVEGQPQAGPPVELPLHHPAAPGGPPPRSGEDKMSPFLGHHDERGLALLYNGILGDKHPAGGNVLTRATLAVIREGAGGFDGPITVYGEATRLGAAALAAERITFKQTPYDVRAR